MKIAIACDHAGFPLKKTILDVVNSQGFEPIDLGTKNVESVDYPDYAEKVGRMIQSGKVKKGIIICGSGVGACISANKMLNIYAGLCHDSYTARQAVEHDNINVLCLGARVIGTEIAKQVVVEFLQAKFVHEERHLRRIEKTKKIEKELLHS